jgi:hypothetical protein
MRFRKEKQEGTAEWQERVCHTEKVEAMVYVLRRTLSVSGTPTFCGIIKIIFLGGLGVTRSLIVRRPDKEFPNSGLRLPNLAKPKIHWTMTSGIDF